MEIRDLLPGGAEAPHGVSLDEIVTAHAATHPRDGLRADPAQQTTLDELWKRFGAQEGRIASAFFGNFGKTGAALTFRSGRRFLGRIWWQRPHLHVTIDLATAGTAANLVSSYERLRVKADQLLVGAERANIARMLYDRVCRVIRLVDQMLALEQFKANPELERLAQVFEGAPLSGLLEGPSDDGKGKRARANQRKRDIVESTAKIETALAVAAEEASQAKELCDRAVRRGAIMAYFVGMLVGILVFTGVGVVLGSLLSNADIQGFDVESFLTVFISGAVGAIVSVMSRMSLGDAWFDAETARSYLRLVGMFRPLIGAIFGVALYFGIESGVLQFIQAPENQHAVFFFFAFIAFLAGFSERWASDILVPVKGQIGSDPAAQRGSGDLGPQHD